MFGQAEGFRKPETTKGERNQRNEKENGRGKTELSAKPQVSVRTKRFVRRKFQRCLIVSVFTFVGRSCYWKQGTVILTLFFVAERKITKLLRNLLVS